MATGIKLSAALRPRLSLAEALKANLPSAWLVQGWKPTEINVSKAAVYVTQDEVGPYPAAPQGADETTLTVLIVEPTLDPKTSEDRLEDNLDRVLDVLDRVTALTTGKAKRGVTSAQGGFPAYEITVTLATTRRKK